MTKASPWTVLDSRVLIEDRWIKLRADRLRTDHGAELSPWYVLEYPDWTSIVPITEDGRIVMVRQWRHAAQSWSLELPGGAMDPEDADPIAAAQRELLEETGHAARDARLLYAAYPNPATQTNRIHMVLATGVHEAAPVAHEEGESMSVEFLAVEEVLDAIAQGRIGHALHVGALFAGLAAVGRIRA